MLSVSDSAGTVNAAIVLCFAFGHEKWKFSLTFVRVCTS